MSAALDHQHTGPWTIDDVMALDEDSTQRYELVGETLMMSPAPGAKHQRASYRLRDLLEQAAETAEAPVEVTEAEVAVSVSDEGPGIAPADQEAVFQPFHRTSGSQNVPGIGLGLSIVRQLVERHGGTVRVASVPGHGATFTVRLPRWCG